MIPSSLPGIAAENHEHQWLQLPSLPDTTTEREAFLEEERRNRPRDFIYRFYACGGFWLCTFHEIAIFLRGFDSPELGRMVPFLREVLRVFLSFFEFV
jgi:hypothetical protein